MIYSNEWTDLKIKYWQNKTVGYIDLLFCIKDSLCIKDTINPYYYLLKNVNFSVEESNE